MAKPKKVETVEPDSAKSTAGTSNDSGLERPTLPPSVGPDPNVPWDVAKSLASGEISEDEPVGQAVKELITNERPYSKAKPGKVKIEHHPDGWSGRVEFTGWHEGAHKGYVRLDPNDRDIKFPVEWVGPDVTLPLEWQPSSALVVVDAGDELRVTK